MTTFGLRDTALSSATSKKTVFGHIGLGTYAIQTQRSVWDRVKVIDRSKNTLIVEYQKRVQTRKGFKLVLTTETIPVHTIESIRPYAEDNL